MKHIKNNSGKSMVEMIAVVAIIGVLTAGAGSLIGSAMDAYKENVLKNQIFAIYQNTLSSFKNESNYDKLGIKAATLNAEIIDREIIPSEMIVDSKAKHIMSGDLFLYKGPTSTTFIVELTDLDSNSCSSILTALSDEIIKTVKVGSVLVSSTDLDGNTEMGVSAVVSACSALDTSTDAVGKIIEITFKENYFFSR